MVEGRFIVRGIVATLLSPLVGGFVVALLLTASIFILMPEGTSSNFVTFMLFVWLTAAFFGGPFIMVATLLTQIPLTILHRKRGRRAVWMHLAASAALAFLLFLLLAQALTGMNFMRSFDLLKEEDLIWMANIAVGAVSVGMLWDWLVLKPMFKGG